MIIPQKKSESIHKIRLNEKQIKMKIKIEQEDFEPKKSVDDTACGALLVPEFSALSLKEASSDDDETSAENNVPVVKEEEGANNEDAEIDPSKLVGKGRMRNKLYSNRAQNEPYTYPQQPSANQTTIIDGRQMAGSHVSEAVWIEGDKNEIPSPVTEWTSSQTPTQLENHQQPYLNPLDLYDFDLNAFTAEDVSHVCAISNGLANIEDDLLGISIQNIAMNGSKPWGTLDEGYSDLQPAESFLGIQPNIPDGCNVDPKPKTSSSEWMTGETSCEDPNSPDSAYGSIGREESPRNSPKSDFVMPHVPSPRYQDNFESASWIFDCASSHPVQNHLDDVGDQYLQNLTIQAPLMNIPAQETLPPPRQELLDISYSQNIPLYVPSNVDGNMNVPTNANDVAASLPHSSKTPQTHPSLNITPEPQQEKKKSNHQIMNQPKKNLPPLLPSGPCNVKPSNIKITDRTLQKRLESMMKPLQKEMLWKKTILESVDKFCMKNNRGQTSLMELLLLEPRPDGRLPNGLLEAIYTRISRIKSQKLADLLCHRDNFGHCALYQAATLKHNTPEIAAYIAETYASLECDVNKPYRNGNTILHTLAQLGDEYDRVLDELLSVTVNGERIFRIDERNEDGNTPLHVAAEHHRTSTTVSTYGIASTLMKHRCSVSKQNSVGATPLHVAARLNACHPEYFRKLLEQRGAENIQDINGNTPLHLVASAVNLHNVRIMKEVVGYLRSSNARLDIRNKEGRCPMDNVHPHLKEEIRKVV